jgi:hypothetical protein
MTTRTARQARRPAVAFSLAALFTLAMFGGVGLLAAPPAADLNLAASAAPSPLVVIEAHRAARG